MILGTAISRNGVPIRLTEERWEHILERHPRLFDYDDWEMALDVVENPAFILPGHRGTMKAVVPFGSADYLCVVYREKSRKDGFIVTAYNDPSTNPRQSIWRRK